MTLDVLRLDLGAFADGDADGVTSGNRLLMPPGVTVVSGRPG